MHRYSTPLLAAGLVIASALSSCVDDKAFKYNQGDPVGFTTDVHNQSRSGLIHPTQNLDSFHVFAFCPDGSVFFHNLHVQKTDPEEITDIYYGLDWQSAGGPY